MITENIKEARRIIDWVSEHLEFVGGKNKQVYIDGLTAVDELLKDIQKLLEEAR